MTFDLKVNLEIYPVRIGMVIQNIQGNLQQETTEYPYSGLNLVNDIDNLDKIQRIDSVSEFDIYSSSNINKGRFYQNLTNNDPDSFLNPGLKCQVWLNEDEEFYYMHSEYIAEDTGSCPCDISEVLLSVYEEINARDMQEMDNIWCYRKYWVLATEEEGEGLTPRCCYDRESGEKFIGIILLQVLL